MSTKTITTRWGDYETQKISFVNPKNGRPYKQVRIRNVNSKSGCKYLVGYVPDKQEAIERAIELYEKWGIETG